jgi:predicted Holliday junction resolvase-like endonuclease
MKIGVGVPVALVLVLLAILAFLVFQIRRQKRRLQLQSHRVDVPLQHEEVDPGMQELDITHYELAHPNAPQHEIAGNGIYEFGQSRLRVH